MEIDISEYHFIAKVSCEEGEFALLLFTKVFYKLLTILKIIIKNLFVTIICIYTNYMLIIHNIRHF